MPIKTTTELTPARPSGAQPSYIVFYSSKDETGQMWCPDCRDVEDLVERTFGGSDSPELTLVYVGSKPEWRDPSNASRKEYNLTGIPTIIRYENGKETARLVEAEMLDDAKWKKFIQP